AARLTGWRVDIKSESEFAEEEAELGLEPEEETSGRCQAILSTGKRCPNASLPGSRYCGLPAHQALEHEPAPAAEEPAPEEPAADEPVPEEQPAAEEVVVEAEAEVPVEEAAPEAVETEPEPAPEPEPEEAEATAGEER